MELYNKINQIKQEIKKSKTKKGGFNEYSKYNYFTPEQIETLVFEACNKFNVLTKFDLIRNEHGETGRLTIINLDESKGIDQTPESIVYEMATAIPSITATNVAQQLGGCVTYTERYLKMSAFGIIENSLDPDDKKAQRKEPEDNREWLNKDTQKWSDAVAFLSKDGTIKQIETKYKVSKENRELLMTEAV